MGEPITTPNTAGDALAHGCRRPSNCPPGSAGGGSLRDPPDDLGADRADRSPGVVVSLSDHRLKKCLRGSPKPPLLTAYRNVSAELERVHCQVDKLLDRCFVLIGRRF